MNWNFVTQNLNSFSSVLDKKLKKLIFLYRMHCFADVDASWLESKHELTDTSISGWMLCRLCKGFFSTAVRSFSPQLSVGRRFAFSCEGRWKKSENVENGKMWVNNEAIPSEKKIHYFIMFCCIVLNKCVRKCGVGKFW